MSGISFIVIKIQEFRSKVEESSRTAEDFTKLYYDSLDKKRHVSYFTINEINSKKSL